VKFNRKDLLGIRDLSREEIQLILDTAIPMKDVIKRDIKGQSDGYSLL
jgi:aspartate carbamoyltransferase catalytic subunit